MYTILQQGEQDNWFYTLQVNGQDLQHFTTLESASNALERAKEEGKQLKAPSEMTRWYTGGQDEQ